LPNLCSNEKGSGFLDSQCICFSASIVSITDSVLLTYLLTCARMTVLTLETVTSASDKLLSTRPLMHQFHLCISHKHYTDPGPHSTIHCQRTLTHIHTHSDRPWTTQDNTLSKNTHTHTYIHTHTHPDRPSTTQMIQWVISLLVSVCR